MKDLIPVLFCLLVPSIASASGFQQTAAENAVSQKADNGTIQLAAVKHLRKGVETWPLIANPASPVEQRVNATLTRLNRSLAKDFLGCDGDSRESAKNLGEDQKGKDAAARDWSRSVRVTMAGPRFLSIVAIDETNCGGAHPDSDTLAMVFDMTTGKPVNWIKLLPESSAPSALIDSVSDGTTVGALVLPALQKMNLAAADAECKDAFLDPQGFLLWPDAKHETLVAQPFDLPHVVRACANEISLTLDQARKMGFDETLLGAIQQAHSQSLSASKH